MNGVNEIATPQERPAAMLCGVPESRVTRLTR
jgi:hypothetical protein